jgi:membrane protein
VRAAWRGLKARLRKLGARIFRVPYLHGVLAAIGRTVRGFVQDDCHIMAAAISFYAVLSLIPFVLLLISITGYVLGNIGQDYANQDELFAHLAEYVRAVIPFTNENFIERLRGMTTNREAYGATGLVILFITSGLVFRSLELAFARVFKTARHRSLLAHQLLFVAFILGIGLLFLGVHYLSVIGSSVASGRHEGFSDAFHLALKKYALLRFGASLLAGTLVFFVLLKYFSRERIRKRASLLAGVLFAGLWMVAAKVFGYYLENLARFSLLYGSLATPAVIVVWIFYSACILLLCAEFAKVLQDRLWPLGNGSNGLVGDPDLESNSAELTGQGNPETVNPASEGPAGARCPDSPASPANP